MLLNEPQSNRRDDNEEIKEYLTTLVRESIGVENPAAPDPPDIPYDWITREQIHRMSDDQRVKYCLNALRYGATHFTREASDNNDAHPEDGELAELRAVAKALLVVNATLSKFGVSGRLRKLDRWTLEELVSEPCNLSTARERAQTVRRDDWERVEPPRTEHWSREGSYREGRQRSPKYALPPWAVPKQYDELNRKVGKGVFDFAVGWLVVFGVFWLLIILWIIGINSG